MSPRVVDLADRIFDVVAADAADPPPPGDALEALMFAAACFGRQCRATRDGMFRTLERAWSEAVAGLPEMQIEVCDEEDLEAAVRETEAKYGRVGGL